MGTPRVIAASVVAMLEGHVNKGAFSGSRHYPDAPISLLAQEAGNAGLRGGSVGAELDLRGRVQY